MRTAILILALLFPLASTAETVTATKWQDYAPLLDRQSKKLNEHTATITALKTQIEAQRVAYNTLLNAILIQVCYANSKIDAWKLPLLGLRATPIGSHVCPANLDTAQFAVPQFLITPAVAP